jgi:hypothetical protein
LIKKKTHVQIKIFNEIKAIDSPINTIMAPMMMGFLTCLYIPLITIFFVGFQGARVPLPILIKVNVVIAIHKRPIDIIRTSIENIHTLLMAKLFSIIQGINNKAVKGRTSDVKCLNTLFISLYLVADGYKYATNRHIVKGVLTTLLFF